ncbi:condensation domain-containing protein, partial [Kibdelosporangium lantanae]
MTLPDGSAVLCLVVHHLVMDGVSFAVFTDELSTVYEAELGGGSVRLPEPTASYADYVAWQRENTDVESRLAYWRDELSGARVLDLPVDFPRPDKFTAAGATSKFVLSAETTTALKAIALRWRCTLSSAMAAIFQVALAVYSGEEDVVIGAVLNGRQRTEFEDVVGLFVNTVTLRTKVSATTSFREYLRTAQATMSRAYAHQEVPFDQVVAELRPDRRPGRNPLFEVLYIYQGEHAPQIEGTRTLRRLPWLDVVTRFDIEFRVEVLDDQLVGTFIYRPELFRPETINQLGNLVTRLVELLVNDPDGSLYGANLGTGEPAERDVMGLG